MAKIDQIYCYNIIFLVNLVLTWMLTILCLRFSENYFKDIKTKKNIYLGSILKNDLGQSIFTSIANLKVHLIKGYLEGYLSSWLQIDKFFYSSRYQVEIEDEIKFQTSKFFIYLHQNFKIDFLKLNAR